MSTGLQGHLRVTTVSTSQTQGSHSFTDKNPGLFQEPMKNFPGSVQSQRMFKYKEKTAFIYNNQSVVHRRKFTMKQNVDVSCSEFRGTVFRYGLYIFRLNH